MTDPQEERRRDVSRRLYRASLLSFAEWVRKADDLFAATSCLEPQVSEVWEARFRFRTASPEAARKAMGSGVFGIYFMLTAYAIENLFKAALIRERHLALDEEIELTNQLPRLLPPASPRSPTPAVPRDGSRCCSEAFRKPRNGRNRKGLIFGALRHVSTVRESNVCRTR